MAVLSAAGARGSSITQCQILSSPKASCEIAGSSQTLPLHNCHGVTTCQSRVPSLPRAQCHSQVLNATRAGPIQERASPKSRQLKAIHCGSSNASPLQQLGLSPRQGLTLGRSLLSFPSRSGGRILLANACRGRALQSRGALGGAQSRSGSHKQCGLLGGSAFFGVPLARKCGLLLGGKGRRKGRGSALACSCSVDLAANMFTFGTALVVPFYTLMLAAPKKRITRKVMDSALPYIVLGAMYMYLLYISWTPEHPKLMFSSKYWLPELSGITRMFSSMLTVSSAWIHLLAVDLFAGRNIYLDSLTHNLPCRHSLVLCLMFGPVGIFSHLFTKNVVMAWRKATKSEEDNTAPEAGPVDVFPNEPFVAPNSEAATEPVDGSEY